MDKVQVERNSAAEPRAVLLRLTPEEAETLQVAWLTARTIMVGCMAHMNGEDDSEASRLVKNGMMCLMADTDTADNVHALLKEVHMQLHHSGSRSEPEAPEQNWRCN